MTLLAYTLDKLLTEQAVFERNASEVDAGGASTRPNWQYLSTVRCRLWWDKASGASSRSPNREYVSPARTVPMSMGGILVPLGTDVTEDDRIRQIQDQNGNLLFDGLFTIVAVMEEDDQHMEISIQRPKLGS